MKSAADLREFRAFANPKFKDGIHDAIQVKVDFF